MESKIITLQHLEEFQKYLIREEKSAATVEKYIRDVRAFFSYADSQEVTKERVIMYKKKLEEDNYAVRSINSMIASINSFFSFINWPDFKVKSIRVQRQIYQAVDKELTKREYLKLLKVAEKNPQLHLIMQTICGTGIRVSELRYFSIEAIKCGEINIHCKGKMRKILIPGKLQKLLIKYAKKEGIKTGPVFLNRNGQILDRSVIWAKMKRLCKRAGVNAVKVFPHNLRKLFARTFYQLEKDVAKLADVLGHGSIETTRIYIMGTGQEHRQKIEKLGLVI